MVKYKNLRKAKRQLIAQKLIPSYSLRGLTGRDLDTLIGNYSIEVDAQIEKTRKAFNELAKLDRVKMLLQQEKLGRDRAKNEKLKIN